MVAGTMRYAELNPGLPTHLFSNLPSHFGQYQHQNLGLVSSTNSPYDEFGVNEIDDQDLVEVGEQRLIVSPFLWQIILIRLQ